VRWLALIALSSCAGGALPIASPDLGGVGCGAQDDCADGTVCMPATVGAVRGACVQPSNMHCASCAADSDCGSPTARCFEAPGDSDPACHLDCSLSYLACPPDYNCSPVLDGAGTRMLCLPMSNRCGLANGGTCTGTEMQPCSKSNPAGTCVGHRACVNGTFAPCDALDPVPLASCGAVAPAGCTLMPSPAALATASDCGQCGNACPGVAAATAEAACVDPANAVCGISCRGDNYDIDGDAANGCEVADADPGDHLQSTATKFPDTDCNDSTSQNTFSGQLLSDTRTHADPAVIAFDPVTGAAPHFFSVYSSGGTLCEDDYSLTFTTTGGADVPCYQASIETDKIVSTVYITGNASGTISGGAGSYSDGTTIVFKIEKTCSTVSVGDADVSFTVSYHL
jgi:hypothetical protein